MHYWLFKTEPSAFSYDHLANALKQTAPWDGVRNYQARNFLRDDVQVGDEVFVYHSSIPEPAIVGIAKVVKAGYADHTAWDSSNEHFDPKSAPEKPLWYMVDVQAVCKLDQPVTLNVIKTEPALAHCSLFTRPRLSIHPITATEWQTIIDLSHPKSA